MAHPHSPAHLNVHNSTLSDEQTESFTSTIQDAHHATTPLLPVPLLRSVAHEMPREPYRLRCGGSHRREHDSHHTHIDDVPQAPPPRLCQAHPSSDAPLCYTLVLAAGADDIVPPCMYVLRRIGACLLPPQKCGIFYMVWLNDIKINNISAKLF